MEQPVQYFRRHVSSSEINAIAAQHYIGECEDWHCSKKENRIHILVKQLVEASTIIVGRGKWQDEDWVVLENSRSYGKIMVSQSGKVKTKFNMLKLSPDKKGYLEICDRSKGHHRVHRLVAIAFLPTPTDDQTQVDHINGDRTDNRFENLRWCSNLQNSTNKDKVNLFRGKPTSSQFKGVSATKSGKWGASIKKNYKTYHIGTFVDEEEAAKAYDEKAKELNGGFAKLNFP